MSYKVKVIWYCIEVYTYSLERHPSFGSCFKFDFSPSSIVASRHIPHLIASIGKI